MQTMITGPVTGPVAVRAAVPVTAPVAPVATLGPPVTAAARPVARGEVATVSGGRLGLRVLVAGLAALYAANALGAVLDPTPFLALIPGGSGHRWLGFVIGANDASVAAALVVTEWGRGRFASARAWQGAVLAWAGVWLTLAAALKGVAL